MRALHTPTSCAKRANAVNVLWKWAIDEGYDDRKNDRAYERT